MFFDFVILAFPFLYVHKNTRKYSRNPYGILPGPRNGITDFQIILHGFYLKKGAVIPSVIKIHVFESLLLLQMGV